MTQTGFSPTVGDQQWYMGDNGYGYVTFAQIDAAFPGKSQSFRVFGTLQGRLEQNGYNSFTTLRPTTIPVILSSSTAENNINTYVFRGLLTDNFPNRYTSGRDSVYNADGNRYYRISKIKDLRSVFSNNTNPSKVGADFFIGITPSGLINEVWFVDYQKKTFTQIA
jgi:hypothetical protein